MSELPAGWVEAELGEFFSRLRTGPFGSSVHKTDYIEGGRPLINPMHINGGEITPSLCVTVTDLKAHQLGEFALQRGDVIIGRRGEMGRCAVVTGDQKGWLIGTGSMAITPNEGLASEFLQLFLANPETVAILTERAIGSTMVNLNQSILAGLQIATPPLPEQRRIVARVEGLTARTARARADLARIPTLIARYKQRLLAQLFELVEQTNDATRIGDLAAFVTSGSRGWAQYYSDDGDLFVRVGNVKRANIELDLSDVQQVIPPKGAEGRRTQLEPNDLLITITADLGRVGVYTDERIAYVNQHVALARLIEPTQANYIAWYLSSERGQAQLLSNNRGATKAGLGLDDIRDVAIPVPPLPEQAEIVRRIEAAFGWLDRVAADHAAAARLIPKLDAAILAKAFRGELVPQDPADEPASVLLDRIAAARASAPAKAKRGAPSRAHTSRQP